MELFSKIGRLVRPVREKLLYVGLDHTIAELEKSAIPMEILRQTDRLLENAMKEMDTANTHFKRKKTDIEYRHAYLRTMHLAADSRMVEQYAFLYISTVANVKSDIDCNRRNPELILDPAKLVSQLNRFEASLAHRKEFNHILGGLNNNEQRAVISKIERHFRKNYDVATKQFGPGFTRLQK